MVTFNVINNIYTTGGGGVLTERTEALQCSKEAYTGRAMTELLENDLFRSLLQNRVIKITTCLAGKEKFHWY
jgi:hypothetical protein